jgi:hypothetical protein
MRLWLATTRSFSTTSTRTFDTAGAFVAGVSMLKRSTA